MRATPTSAKTASHIIASPKIPRPMKVSLTPRAKIMFCHTIPCVLPVIAGALSLTFARRRVEAIIAGMVASFALLGALVGSLGSYASQIQGALYLIGGAGFILSGRA